MPQESPTSVVEEQLILACSAAMHGRSVSDLPMTE